MESQLASSTIVFCCWALPTFLSSSLFFSFSLCLSISQTHLFAFYFPLPHLSPSALSLSFCRSRKYIIEFDSILVLISGAQEAQIELPSLFLIVGVCSLNLSFCLSFPSAS